MTNKFSGTVGVVGLGYVGLPLALRFAEAGVAVLGFDIDQAKVDALNSGKSYIKHIGNEAVALGKQRGLTATADFSRAGEPDALIICVPTPLNKYREPDLSFVTNTMDSLLPWLRKGQLVSLESTTYPGTTEEELKPRIESRGLVVGKDVFLVYSPEREDPGNASFRTQTIPKVVGGSTPACLAEGVKLYSAVIDKEARLTSRVFDALKGDANRLSFVDDCAARSDAVIRS